MVFKILAMVVGAMGLAPAAVAICNIQNQVATLLQSDPLPGARVGVVVQTPDGRSLVDIDGDRYFTPASNVKLFTTAAALAILGKNDRFSTTLGLDQQQQVWIAPSGDPSFSQSRLQNLVGAFMEQLQAQNIAKTAHRLQAIPQFQGQGLGQGWQWEDLQEYYGAIADAFIIDENIWAWTVFPTRPQQPVKFRWQMPILGWTIKNQAVTVNADQPYTLEVQRALGQPQLLITGQFPVNSRPELGYTAIVDPQAHFLQLLRAELQRRGMEFGQGQRISTPVQVTDYSPTLENLVAVTNKDSHNLYAEALLRRLGSRLGGDASRQGLVQVQQFLRSHGIRVILRDGSGLSNLSLVTPRSVVQLLGVMADQPEFRKSLAIAGKDGTLKNRLAGLNIQAKTGTLTGVAALSGYINGGLRFSILINNATLPHRQSVKVIDAIATIIATKCPN